MPNSARSSNRAVHSQEASVVVAAAVQRFPTVAAPLESKLVKCSLSGSGSRTESPKVVETVVRSAWHPKKRVAASHPDTHLQIVLSTDSRRIDMNSRSRTLACLPEQK